MLIHVDDPERHGNVRRVEHIPRQHDNGFHTIFLQDGLTNSLLVTVRIQSSVGKKESSDAVRYVKF